MKKYFTLVAVLGVLKAGAAYISHYDAAEERVEIVAASTNFTRLIGMRYPATLGGRKRIAAAI